MKNFLPALLVIAVLLMTGCARQWTLRSEGPDKALQWPYQPNKPKVTYVMSIKGFKPDGDSRSLIDTVVYGNSGDEDDVFRLPVAVSVGGDGRLAVADIGRKCVHLYTPAQQKYIRIYGTDKESFASPVGVAFDDEMRLYVSDSLAGKVFVFGSDGAFMFFLQETDTGRLKRPTGIAYNPKDKLVYVADTLENRIYAFNADGQSCFLFWGKGGRERPV